MTVLKKYLPYERFKHLFRFGMVGVLNTGIDFAVFALLRRVFGIDSGLCQVAGYSAGIINSFLLNKYWTFEDKNKGSKTSRQLLQFIVVNAVTLGITTFGIKVLIAWFGMNDLIAKACVTVLAQVINFLGYKLWVFKV